MRTSKRNIVIISLMLCTFNTLLMAQNLYNNPESVVWDSVNQRYLVSNKGNGKIIAVDREGNQSVFNTDQASIRGLHIMGDRIYAGCNAGVAAFNLSDGSRVWILDIAEKVFLNDVTSDAAGFIYVTDSNGGKVFKVNPADQSYSVLVEEISGPNGILYDRAEDRLLVTTGGPTPSISAIALNDGSVTQLVATPQGSLDGLTEDIDGNIYYSSWQTGSVYKYDRPFTNDPELVSGGHNGPADIGFNADDNVLAIPVFNDNEVIFLQMSGSSAGSRRESPQNFILGQNYPNPFNPETVIPYTVGQAGRIRIDLYDLNGRHISALVDQHHPKGSYEVSMNAENLPSGSYFYKLSLSGKEIRTRKMQVMK